MPAGTSGKAFFTPSCYGVSWLSLQKRFWRLSHPHIGEGTMIEAREPTNWEILKQWFKVLTTSRKVQLAIRIIFMVVVVLFAISVARAA